jgi:hypothetical protein
VAYPWVLLAVLFPLPFVDLRNPWRLLHLDLALLLGVGALQLWGWETGRLLPAERIVMPVVLVSLLARLLSAGFRPQARTGPLVPLVPVTWLAVAVVLLAGFRLYYTKTTSDRVIDVGAASVLGAQRIADGEPLYGVTYAAPVRKPDGRIFLARYPRGDTYGPANYLFYVPFERAMPWNLSSGGTHAARGAAAAFDLLAIIGLLLLGRAISRGEEGTMLGVALAYAWASSPYTLFTLAHGYNDALPAMLSIYALVALRSPLGSGTLTALGAATKFATGALAPLLASATAERRGRSATLFVATFGVVVLALFLPFIPNGGLSELYHRTVGFQATRGSFTTLWGIHPSLKPLERIVQVAALALALGLAFVPKQKTLAQVALLGAAITVALQLGLVNWLPSYVVWFTPLALAGLFAEHAVPATEVTQVGRSPYFVLRNSPIRKAPWRGSIRAAMRPSRGGRG